MIEFLTFFLGIVAGPQKVVVVADDQVAAVELRLDGTTMAALQKAPWEFEVDFGTELLPRKLEAVALDSRGDEVGTALQLLNVPRPAAEVSLVLRHESDGPVQAEIAWESASGKPTEMIALLDDEEVPIIDEQRIDLTRVDTSYLHLLQVEMWFPDLSSARGHLVFGGEYVDETSADLTAFPVILAKGSPRHVEMEGWFAGDSTPLRVATVERGLASLIIVRTPGVVGAFKSLAGRPEQGPAQASGALGPIAFRAEATSGDRQRAALPLDEDLRVRLIVPRALKESGRQLDFDLFSVSPEIRSRLGGLYWTLTQDVVVGGPASKTRVGDAVTLAGTQAAGTNHRRTVLLIVAGPWEDHSQFDVAAVRRYLDALNVPLVVWRVGEDETGGAEWEPAEEISDYGDLKRAWRALEKDLDRQRIVWLEGLHLPNTVQITQGAGVDPVIER